MPRPLATLLLLVTTALWGLAFVAQKSGMTTMGPLTFAAVRYALGALIVLPLGLWELRRRGTTLARADWPATALLCVAFFGGVYLQQAGLLTTSVTNGGFLTSLYVLFVPIIALVILRQPPHLIVWLAMPVALCGVYLLNGGHLDRFNSGDLLVVGSAVCWAVQVLLIGALARRTGLPITLSVLCFGATAILAGLGSFAFETPDLSGIAGGWMEILYTAILATAVGFTLQAVGQQYVPPANAAIILSAESLFAGLGGALLLAERLPAIGYFGAALIFVAILLAEAIPPLARRRAATAANPP